MAQEGGIVGPIRIRSTDERHEPPRFAADRPEERVEDAGVSRPEDDSGDPFAPMRDVARMTDIERAALDPDLPPVDDVVVPSVLSDAYDPEPPVGPDGVELDLDALWFKQHQRMLAAAFEPMRKSLEAEGEISLRLGYNPPLMLEPKLNDQVFSNLRRLVDAINGLVEDEDVDAAG